MSKRRLVLLIATLALASIAFWQLRPEPKPVADKPLPTLPEPEPKTPEFDKTKYSNDQAGSLWWVVNKQRPLQPNTYVPPDLVVPNVQLRLSSTAEQSQISQQAKTSVEAMFAAAKKDGVDLVFGSGYRSYNYQKNLYEGYVRSMGQERTDQLSARPGTSEHQTGLSFDATAGSGKCFLEACFADTAEGKWLMANAYKHGFIVRYPKDKISITGYDYEPWHMRYVGQDLAVEMQRSGVQTLEEFFDLPPAPNY